jgi:hypothetical protein
LRKIKTLKRNHLVQKKSIQPYYQQLGSWMQVLGQHWKLQQGRMKGLWWVERLGLTAAAVVVVVVVVGGH